MEENGVPGENNRPAVSHWQTLSYNVVSPEWWFELTTLVVIGTDCICCCKFNYDTITATTPSPLLPPIAENNKTKVWSLQTIIRSLHTKTMKLRLVQNGSLLRLTCGMVLVFWQARGTSNTVLLRIPGVTSR